MGNSLANNLEGISLNEADARITSNNITANQIGIRFYMSGGMRISGNGITNNTLGIHLTYAGQNDFYHNNFDNEEQVDCYWMASRNTWDNGYPSGGNYWSDYAGTDANLDGIGDTPYIIDVHYDPNITDHYPLMKPYVDTLGDINGDGKVDMKDVGYVARRFMCVPSDPLWDSIADLNSDGKINMIDIGTVARHFGEHYP
jgi:parallel beta-helix repeat protein